MTVGLERLRVRGKMKELTHVETGNGLLFLLTWMASISIFVL